MEQNIMSMFSMEDALEMIFMFDGTGKISYANTSAREKLQYGKELCGKHISAVFPGTFKETEDGFETDYIFGHEQKNLVAYRRNLTCFPVEARIVQSEGSPQIYICMANDILEKEFLSREVEQVRQEAKQAMKVKSEFVANVTHELRTPVNGVLGNVRELMDTVTDEKTMKSLQLIERCCGDMNKIINNILDFSKLEAGKFTLEPRKFHFRDMLNYVKAQHINKITEKGLGFFLTVSPQIPEYVVGDELRIVQILNNLLSNAQKFTTVGKITVEVLKTAQANGKVELFFIVKDTGIGISDEDRDKLFQSFSQVDASISRKYGGTGLGLNITKQLVELMGGRIELESEKNKGSTFTFSLWLGACEGDEGAPAAPEQMTTTFEMAPPEDDAGELEDIRKYGTPENFDTLKRNLSKLILCVEMENWEKAEMFMETIRQLTDGAPHEVSRGVLKLKMAIQKENYDKALAEYEALNHFVTAPDENK
ncbi:MAG: ATP-binding protein [Lachnoclostridium sp.]|nr:ATP-binding protein [Lachnospira sp.]MCM1247702.1 ATP-binding protein [Lachnoclostridium sp.]MCM1536373.1 ATP-binding protein [Clostridium sp.]